MSNWNRKLGRKRPEAFLQPQQSDRTQLWCTSTQASFFWPRSYVHVLFCPCDEHTCLYCCSSSGLWVSSNWQNNSCLSSTCHFSLFFINLKTLLLISVCMDTFLCVILIITTSMWQQVVYSAHYTHAHTIITQPCIQQAISCADSILEVEIRNCPCPVSLWWTCGEHRHVCRSCVIPSFL